jgi:hypothetical protein
MCTATGWQPSCLCVNVYCHRVITQLQLINIYIYKLWVFLKTSDRYRILESEDSCLLGCHAMLFGAGVTAACSTRVLTATRRERDPEKCKIVSIQRFLISEGSQTVPTCPSDKSNSKMNEWVWSIDGMILTGEDQKCHFLHHKFHMDWSGTEPEPVRWEAGA